jgi:MFS family permease
MTSVRSDIPARLDRLPWSGWHWRVVLALGVSWLLDGLEVTVVGSLGPALQRGDTLGLSASDIGWSASAYIAGAVLGAIFFGRLADHLGRKRMFLVTLAVYLVATVLTAFTWNLASSRASASEGNTPRSTRRSTSSFPRGCAGASISRSTARSGSAPRSARH